MAELALFPLQSVLFPGGELALKVFEARYLDLMGRCLRDGVHFGVVNLKRGAEVQRPGADETSFESVGVMAQLEDVDVPQPGIMLVRAVGLQRFAVHQATRGDNGLWTAQITLIDDDDVEAPAAQHAATVAALATALAHLKDQGIVSQRPTRMDDAGWVANRWCELLPIPAAAKQSLMELQDPLARLSLVDRFLRDNNVIA